MLHGNRRGWQGARAGYPPHTVEVPGLPGWLTVRAPRAYGLRRGLLPSLMQGRLESPRIRGFVFGGVWGRWASPVLLVPFAVDSKQLNESQRDRLFEVVNANNSFVGWNAHVLSPQEISGAMLQRYFTAAHLRWERLLSALMRLVFL